MRRAAAALLALAFVTACSTLDGGAVDSAAASSVTVQIGPTREDGTFSHGSGVVVAKGKVMTAQHVALGVKGVLKILTADGTELTLGKSAELGDDSVGEDYAILDVETGSIPPANHSCDKVVAGTQVFTYGAPVLLRDVATFGRVASNTSPKYEGAPKGAVVLDMTVLPGNSGGGVFTMMNGRPTLIGIVTQLVPYHGGATTLSVMLPLSSTSICDHKEPT